MDQTPTPLEPTTPEPPTQPFGQPITPPVAPIVTPVKSTLALWSMILGIVSIVLALLFFIAAPAAIVAITLGIIALAKGEFKITANRKVKGSTGRDLGIVLLFGAGCTLIPYFGGLIQILVLIGVIVGGLLTSEKIEKSF